MNSYQNVEYSVIPYNQEEVEQVLKQMLWDKGVTDVLYEGSNISQLSSVISYVISSLNINTAINLQETLLPLATKRMNILFGARQLGYEARPRKSFKYNLNCRPTYNKTDVVRDTNGGIIYQDGREVLNIVGTTKFNIPLNHNTKFTCGGYTYYYVGPTIPNFWENITNELITLVTDPDSLPVDPDTGADIYLPATEEQVAQIYKTIEVKEGLLFTPADSTSLSMTARSYTTTDGIVKVKQDYIIPYKNIEENGLNVQLTYLNDDADLVTTPRYQTKQYLIDENMSHQTDLFARVENIILGLPVIFFQMAEFGNPIRKGTLIEVEVLVSSGNEGEAVGIFKVDEDGIETNFEVYDYTILERGLTEETSDSIKENAMVYHNTANRAVTKYDYQAITRRNAIVREASAWGGEEEIPKEKGHIWISCIPKTQTKTIKYSRNGNEQTYKILIGPPNFKPAEGPFLDVPNYNNWFMTPSVYDNAGWITTKGQQEELAEYLEPFKMMTTEVWYRHPLYVDFELKCDIVKYNVTKSVEQINYEVFNTINSFFITNLEKFNSEYINSKLQRAIDKQLGISSGITFSIKTTGSLCRNMIDNFNSKLNTLETYECPARVSRSVIKCSLAFPFESLFQSVGNTSELVISNLPNIDTSNFGMISQNLWVDYAALVTGLPNQNKNFMETEIYLGNVLFGSYVVNRLTSTIELTFIFDEITENDIFGPTPIADDEYINFNIVYPNSIDTSTNIPFIKNTIPRLKNVTFIYND